MKQEWKERMPALFSVLVFLAVEGINIFGNVPKQQWKNFEIMSNMVLLGIAIVSFLWVGLPCASNGKNLGSILSNMAVSAVAFPMNIDVFGHTISLEQPLEDLWGWHFGWILCLVIQILFLSGLGRKLLDLARGLLKWGKDTIRPLGNAVSGLAASIEHGDKGVTLTIAGGLILWVIYLGHEIVEKGVFAVLSDADFLWGSVRLWIVCIMIGFLLNLVPSVFRKAKEAVHGIGSKKILVVIALAATFAVASCALVSLWKAIGITIVILAIALSLTKFVIGRAREKEKKRAAKGGTPGEQTINRVDLTVLLISFIEIPLVVICVATVLSAEGSKIINTQNITDLATWLNLLNVALEITKNLLQVLVG